jgi:hypothetical protein
MGGPTRHAIAQLLLQNRRELDGLRQVPRLRQIPRHELDVAETAAECRDSSPGAGLAASVSLSSKAARKTVAPAAIAGPRRSRAG